MNVYLYYVEGISRIDTPYFATKTIQASLSKQEEFFDNHLVKTVELSFYPPHYRNSIRFEEEDLTIKDNVNYLALDYNGKRYYYFIDDVSYISETLIEVDITMDVIQTYMFDIYISSGIIERKFIDRWIPESGSVGYLINRSYVRENASSNEFLPLDKSYINLNNKYEYMLFIKQTKISKESTVGNLAPSLTISYMLPDYSYANRMNNNLGVPYDLKIGPASLVNWYKSDDDTKISTMLELVAHCSYIAETLDMYICPFNPLAEVTISQPSGLSAQISGRYPITLERGYLNFEDMHGQFEHYYFRAVPYNLAVRYSYTAFGFVRNNSQTRVFDWRCEPALLDDNYIRYTFGTSVASATYPLFLLRKDGIYGHYAFDPTNGTRIYFINTEQNSDEDFCNTTVVDTNVLTIDLKNEPWAQYIANNKNRWAQLNTNNILSISSAAASYAGSSSKVGKIGVDKTASTKYNYAKIQARNKKGQFTRASVRKIGMDKVSSSRDVYGDVPANANAGGIAGSALGAIGNVFDQYYTEKNLLAAPSSLSQLGEAVNGVASQSHLIYHYKERVQDFEQCARYYQRNGYLVNEYINSNSNIFGYVQNRYYFNILKMELPNVHLNNILEDDDTIDAITERLVDGLRLWNVLNQDVSIGNYLYDNVENSFIS